MKRILKHFKKNWYRYGLETIVVIMGVLIAFTLNNWNETRKDKIRAGSHLKEIEAELL